jgi:hypothetical protein
MGGREVKISLVVDESGAVKALRTTGNESHHTEGKFEELDKKVKGLGKSFGGLKGIIGAGIGAVGISGAAFGLKDLISKTSEVAEETHKFHSITGIGAQSSLDYTAALKARGIGAEAGGNAFKFLAKNIETAERQEHTFGVAQETAGKKHKATTTLLGVQAAGFQKLGVNLSKFGQLSEQAKFETITEKFEGMKAGVDKTRLAVQIFGRGGTALLPVLEKGALSLNHYDQMAKKFFPTLKGGANSLEELQERQAESSLAWEGLEFTLGTKLIPVVTEAEGEFSKWIGEAERGHGTWGRVEKDIEGVWTVSKDVVGILDKMGKAFNIHVGAGGLGAALMAFAGIHTVKHPVKAAGTSAKVLTKGAKFAYQHPETAPIVLPSLAAAAYGIEVYKSRKELAAHAQGALNMFNGIPSLNAIKGVMPGSAGEAQWLKAHAGALGNTSLGGNAADGPIKPSEATLVARLLEHPRNITPTTISRLTPGEAKMIADAFERAASKQPIHTHIYLQDREIAEAVTSYAKKEKARQ